MVNMTLDQYLSNHDRLVVGRDVKHCFDLLLGKFNHPSYYYRGISKEKYRLLSSLDRMVLTSSHIILGKSKFHKGFREQLLIREFKKIAPNHLSANSIPKTHFEWLSVMQHYGVPTRLLDLTKSPFVALYFAVREWGNPEDAAIWAIAPHTLHEVSFLRLKKNNFPYPMRDTNYSYSQMPDFLADEYFSEAFLSGKYDVAMILNPAWANLRLASQQGAFLISSSEKALEEAIVDLINDKSYFDPIEAEMRDHHRIDMSVMKLIIPGEIKKAIFNQLRKMNIHAGTLFPGIEGAAQGVLEYGAAEEWETHMEIEASD
jgi:hypothetical protein